MHRLPHPPSLAEHGLKSPLPHQDWEILIVDDDPQCLSGSAELVETLGYTCTTADNAMSGLRAVADNQRIGLVITDINMPGLDGLTLLEELSERFVPQRPLVVIVITGAASMEAAIRAMRARAIDLLPKPVSLGDMSSALRRAKVKWNEVANGPGPILGDPSGLKFDLDRLEQHKSKPSPADLEAFAQAIMKSRQARAKFFDTEIIAGPGWDILIDLAVAGLKGEMVATSSVCESADVPYSTAFRHIKHLIATGMIRPQRDSADKRRTLLSLEDETLDAMTEYLKSSWEIMRH